MRKPIALLPAGERARDGLACGAEDTCACGFAQLRHATGVVPVVVGDEDGVQLQALLLQPLRKAVGFARIHRP